MAFGDELTAPIRGLKQQFLNDPIGTLVRGIDNGQRIPQTATVTSYALTLYATVAGKGRLPIGAVHEIAVAQSLTLDEEFDVDAFAIGLPRELVPQTVTGRTLTLQRYELYKEPMSRLFGAPGFELLTLAQQPGPLSLRMVWTEPGGSGFGIISEALKPQMRVYDFVDCRITSFGQTVSTQNVIVGANATLVWRNIVPLL